MLTQYLSPEGPRGSRRSCRLLMVAVVVAVGLSGAQPLAAQEPRRITFDEAIRTALKQNSDLRLAKNTAALDAVAVRQQRLQFLPSLELTTQGAQNYGRNFSESEGRVIDQATQSLNMNLSSSVVLFDGLGNIASLREAQLAGDASELDLQRTQQTVVFTVASNYLSLIRQQEQLRVQRENLAAAEALERQIREYVDAGVRPIADLYQQQATVASGRLAVVEAERASELAKVDLMQTLQLDARETYQFETPAIDADSAGGQQYNLDSLLTRALTQRADLDAEEARHSAAEQGVRAAGSAYWPTISLSAGYNTGFSSASDFGFVDQLDQRRGGSVGIGVSIPLFDRGSARTATQQARIQADNARITLENQRQKAGLEVRRAHLDYQAAAEQLRAAEAQQRAARLALQTSEERYEVGAATLVELTQARAVQVQAASALVTARYNLLFQRTLMDYYIGDLDPERISLG